MAQILDIPVPQLVDQLADVMRFFDTLLPVPEQAIKVSKMLLDDVPVRTVRDTQLVEQLVEVPTIVLLSSLERTVEHHVVDFPVSRGAFKIIAQDRVHPLLRMFQLAIKKGFLARSWVRT